MLEVLLEPLPQWVGDLVEADELLDLLHLGVIAGRAAVEPLDDGTDVAKDAGVHQGWEVMMMIMMMNNYSLKFITLLSRSALLVI